MWADETVTEYNAVIFFRVDGGDPFLKSVEKSTCCDPLLEPVNSSMRIVD